jgi:hypothetical protein
MEAQEFSGLAQVDSALLIGPYDQIPRQLFAFGEQAVQKTLENSNESAVEKPHW